MIRNFDNFNKINEEYSDEYSDEYLEEVNKTNILNDLENIRLYITNLEKMIGNSNNLDNETKKNILNLREISHDIYNKEMDKELNRQKAAGKKFISDEDIDSIIDKIKREGGYL